MTDVIAQAKTMIERGTGYVMRDEDLLLEALDTTGLRKQQSNQRLAMLGDVVLKHVLLDEWYAAGTSKGR